MKGWEAWIVLISERMTGQLRVMNNEWNFSVLPRESRLEM